MKYRFLKFTSVALAAVISAGLFGACTRDDGDPTGGGEEDQYLRDPSGKTYDNETDVLTFSTLEVDRVFNPFFSTSATDGNVVGLTQIGMLANDREGNVVYGADEDVVTLDLEVSTTGTGENQTTEYKFVLKNNVRFSDGTYLTMKDVFFNLYVYLDPAYTGSTTMYSTDIVGLQEYRTQTTNEAAQREFMKQFNTEATQRIENLTQAATDLFKENDKLSGDPEAFRTALAAYGTEHPETEGHLVGDYDKALELFGEELESDYTNSLNSYEDAVFVDNKGVEHRGLFTTDVEQFLYNEGIITWNKRGNNGDGEMIYPNGLKDQILQWDKDDAIEEVWYHNIPDKIGEVINYWVTADNLFTYLANDAMEKYFRVHPPTYSSISGIKFANKDAAYTVNGRTYEKPTYVTDEWGEHVETGNEVLSITIHKVDPKAIWNFAFGVAPMAYYSDEDHVAAFDFDQCHFGVDYSSQTFLQEVVNSSEKVGLPMGAGPYLASKASGGVAASKDEFYSANMIYYERNPYYLMGPPKVNKVRYQVVPSNQMANSLYQRQITFVEPNAKPETRNEINARKSEGFVTKEVPTLGYGYIGINAGKVPSIKVRQAIMHAINTQMCVEYYEGDAQPVYRSMSRESWAYPENATPYYPYIGGRIPEDYDETDSLGEYLINPDYVEFVASKGYQSGAVMSRADQQEFIRWELENAGYSAGADGVYRDSRGNVLRYTFTVVGETSDHPAWNALYTAGEFLNGCGFDINVTTDVAGLSRLATGSLTVWAAAWGATIDPDMYQVYHMDSTASSVRNWGYTQIKQNTGGRYQTEVNILTELSRLIDEAREVEDHASRKAKYEAALTEVMKLAVELPTYQRNDLFAYDRWKIDESTLNSDVSAFLGLTAKMYNVSLVVA